MKSTFSWLSVCFCFGVVVLGSGVRSVRAEDFAVVVGVNKYPKLVDETGKHPNLEGSVNDAKSVEKVLTGYGFKVKLLTEAGATKAAIVAALKGVGKCDRFVFYFAGHGTTSQVHFANILPSNAEEKTEANDINTGDLDALVRKVPAKSRTVLLDSCFSGGFVRAFGRQKAIRPYLKTRYFTRGSKDLVLREGGPKEKDLKLVKVNGADENSMFSDPTRKATTSPVCYFAASRENQKAAEDDFSGVRHGVFTYYLLKQLNGATPSWGDVQSKVAGNVKEFVDDQEPTLSPAFTNARVFQVPGVNAVAAQPDNLWDIFNGDFVDSGILKLKLDPDRTEFAKDEMLSFGATVGRDGYLVMIEKGTSGKFSLLWPRSATVEDCRVSKGARVEIPGDGMKFAPETAGTENIRAFLFKDVRMAEELLSIFTRRFLDAKEPHIESLTPENVRDRMKVSWQSARRMRDLRLVDGATTKPFYTSSLSFEVVD